MVGDLEVLGVFRQLLLELSLCDQSRFVRGQIGAVARGMTNLFRAVDFEFHHSLRASTTPYRTAILKSSASIAPASFSAIWYQ